MADTIKELKLPANLSWVEDRKAKGSKLKFGPPLFDESAKSYGMRRFKRGFVYGKKHMFKTEIHLGFGISSISLAQFAFYKNVMSPGKTPVIQLAIIPIQLGVLSGVVFGAIEILSDPQLKYKPAIVRPKRQQDNQPNDKQN